MKNYFFQRLFLFTSVLSIISCGQEEKKNEIENNNTRPNIIFIMTDDHAAQAISAYGHPVSKLAPTPNIERIAHNGAV